MDDDLRYAVEGILLGLQRAGVISEAQLPIITQAICDVGKSARSGTAYRCHELAAGVSKGLHCESPGRH